MASRALIFGLFAVAVAAGCGGKGAGKDAEDGIKQIAALLSDFEELPTRPKDFAASFASDAPSDSVRRKYVGNVYRMSGKPKIDGDTATAKVLVQKVNTGAWLGEATWEFAKVGATWKVRSAPLP